MNKSALSSPLSPESVTSETSYQDCVSSLHNLMSENKENDELSSIFKEIGVQNPTKITDSLQGSIWRAFTNHQQNIKPVILKITNKSLHQHSRAFIKDQEFKVREDIVKESKILKHITKQKQCPDSIVKYHGFLATNQHLCLVMEDGGASLFTFVQKVHRFIACDCVELHEWNKAMKIIFKQMLECVSYIHSRNVAHFDISLENFLINDVEIQVDEYEDGTTKMRFIGDDIHVKLCDFGLAEEFGNKPCLSSKFCGKKQYKSPEIVSKKKGFDALKNDVWCLGICWLAMAIGIIPWDKAHESDNVFAYCMAHSVSELLEHWNVLKCVDPRFVHLFEKIFQNEGHRMDIIQIKKYLYQFVFH